MQKNWYIVFTKPKCEKKVSALLTKRKIENFCPINCKQIKSVRKNKVLYEPLFDCYVFTYIGEIDIDQLRHADGVVSLVYWKGQPAIIKNNEIDAIREFTNDHQNIKLERTQVNVNGVLRIIDGPSYSMDGKVLTVKNKAMKVNLPSLGFTMIAEMERESILGREIAFGNPEYLLQS